ncbi:MAG: hypothetical protein JSR40_13640 [Proteobacteria bacterium]|nr:hypothetical protein [Pseudomonadota bacterium]
MSRSVERLLRLEADAWLLRDADGERRQPHGGDPAAVLPALGASLRGGARLKVVLGDGWLRYLVLRWPAAVRTAEERQAFMLHRFRAVHDIAAPDWVLAADRNAVRFPSLACAAPAVLVDAINLLGRMPGVRLGEVVGDFVDRYNQLQRSFDEAGGDLGALAILEGDRLTAGVWRDGAWLALRSRAVGAEAMGDLARMLEGWHAEHAPADEGTLYACGIEPAAVQGWRIVRREDR